MLSVKIQLLCLAPLLSSGICPQPKPCPEWIGQEISNEQLRASWKKLPRDEKSEVAAWFRAECDRRRSLARQLERDVFHSLRTGRGKWKTATEQPVFDPAKHCPAQPIPRRVLPADNPKTLAEQKRLGLNPPMPTPAWFYDWGSGEVLQSHDPFASEHIFELALAGRAPEQDLAVALILQFLDKEQLQTIHRAFSHTYATREGRAFAGISLYDAWNSGVKIEMPDVECLGVIHMVDSDWKSFVAPVPGPLQSPLYDRIGELFHEIRRERGLAEALALSFFQVDPPLNATYVDAKERLQLFWSKHDSALDECQAALPASSQWDSWWETMAQLQTDDALGEKAANRRMALGSEPARIRGIFVWVMKEWGALK